ncbi:MAG: AAA family ATPase [Methylococcales bacterium]|nr:AAA family ATPase [Methylococcales bacterium]
MDEPEIHLHPKWQVEYAKLIVALVKNDIPVLITSHSPEIIQAIDVFSKEYGIQDKTAYYLTESDGISSEINDVTNDINKIFAKLAEPLHNLVWG